MYDPKTARFLQEDTYTGDRNDPLSLNLYTYCHNEPLMYTDPTGHISQDIAMKLSKNLISTNESLDKIIYSGIADPNMREYLKQAKAQYTQKMLAKAKSDDQEEIKRQSKSKGKSCYKILR
jgi:hypothetical protein